jgi:hypothetical protein
VIVAGKRACPPALPEAPLSPAPTGKVIPIQPPVAVPPNGGPDVPGAGVGSSGGAATGSAGSAASGIGTSAGSATGSAGTPVPIDPPEATGPSANEVRAKAGPVLAALGLTGAALRVDTYPAVGQLTAAPVVDRLPTSGYETRLSYDAHLRLVDASGWLATPSAGAEYPLVSARAALASLPVPAIAAMPCPDVYPSRCQPAQAVITGARPGLLVSWTDTGAALLVPAWLYDVRGWPSPLAAIAIDRGYLAPGQPAPAQGSDAPARVPAGRATDAPAPSPTR